MPYKFRNKLACQQWEVKTGTNFPRNGNACFHFPQDVQPVCTAISQTLQHSQSLRNGFNSLVFFRCIWSLFRWPSDQIRHFNRVDFYVGLLGRLVKLEDRFDSRIFSSSTPKRLQTFLGKRYNALTKLVGVVVVLVYVGAGIWPSKRCSSRKCRFVWGIHSARGESNHWESSAQIWHAKAWFCRGARVPSWPSGG